MGHEFTGVVVEVGKSVTTVKVGDKIVSPFTLSWYVILFCLGESNIPELL
jgi:threonine dehydrogenase-like Zn-dependent dehydrogenase